MGKTWLACALGNQACRENLSVLYVRASRLFAELTLGRGDGRYTRRLRGYGKADLLVIDDWGPEPLGADQRRDLLEIVEERYGRKSLLITSQVPRWPTGTPSSEIRPWATRSWTASFTTPIGSS